MLIILAFIPTSNNCSEAYNQFLVHYGRIYDQEKETIFCENYKSFLKIRVICPHCIVSPIYDRYINLMKGRVEIPQLETSSLGNDTCQTVKCYAKDPLPSLKYIPKSVDLRMSGLVTRPKEQGDCGSCWAFVTAAMLENTILLDQINIQQTPFKETAQKLKISEQYIMSNTYGYQRYCEGGNAVSALNYQIDSQFWSTLELEANYPYEYAKRQSDWDKKYYLLPTIKKNEYLIPYKLFPRVLQNNVSGNVETPIVNLGNNKGKMNIDKVKEYLARGIVVQTAINVNITNSSMQILSSYPGNVTLQGFPCTGTVDHNVVIVGYGMFKGVDVWVVKNSWGPNWGNQGHMYIQMNINQFCIENEAFAIIPKNYKDNQGVFNQQYETPFYLIRGVNGLDND